MVSANEGNAVSAWVQAQFRETPWTAWILLANVATWMLTFFGVSQAVELLSGPIGVSTAWKWLFYPLLTLMPIHWFLLFLYVFWWIGTSLERQWGSEKFGRVFVALTLLSACAFWAGTAAAAQAWNPQFAMPLGLTHVELGLFLIWCSINSEATILAFFVIPIKAKWMGIASLVLGYFQMGPILGLGYIAVPIGCWFWAQRDSAKLHGGSPSSKSIGDRLEERRRKKKKSRFKVLEGKKLDAPAATFPESNVPDLRELNREKAAKEKSANEAELDRILDKIRFEGMTALTPEEKSTLDQQSQRLKDEG